jgi:hypothetical protein
MESAVTLDLFATLSTKNTLLTPLTYAGGVMLNSSHEAEGVSTKGGKHRVKEI